MLSEFGTKVNKKVNEETMSKGAQSEPRYTANPIPSTPKSFKEVKSIGLRDLRALCKGAWVVLERGIGSCLH